MVDQKEEAKKEKFIETMPTMIQTHLIMCKDWDMVKDTAKSLEHIIMKCDPPTPAMPMIGIVDKFDTYETALKNTLLNKFAIETPKNKLQEVTLQDGSKKLNYLPGTIMDYASLQS